MFVYKSEVFALDKLEKTQRLENLTKVVFKNL